MKIRAAIIGSCVSGDPFGPAGHGAGDLELSYFYSRTSFASAVLMPVQIEMDPSLLTSSFQRRMVIQDASKSMFPTVQAGQADVIIIDYVDDRFDLLLGPDGTGLTNSPELKRSRVTHCRTDLARLAPYSPGFENLWEQGWTMFVRLLTENDMVGRVLINRVFWATHDNFGDLLDGQDRIAKANRWLRSRYDRVARDLKADQFISYSSEHLVADRDHKWGLSPYHFITPMNDVFIAALKRFVDQRWVH